MSNFKFGTKVDQKKVKGLWNPKNWKYQNITKDLAEVYIQDYWMSAIILLLSQILLYLVKMVYLAELIIMLVLIVGTYKKIRFAGVILFLYFLWRGFSLTIFSSPLIVFVFFKFFYLGVISLFKLHQLNKK